MAKPKRYWLNVALFTFTVLTLASFGVCASLAHDHAMVLIHPSRTLPQRTPSDVNIESWTEVQFPASDGLEITAWFVPVEIQEPSPTLIFVHGLGSNREGLLNQAKLLHDHGYGALLLDLRNHGQSQGEITTLGYQEVLDVEGAVEFLTGQLEVDADRIGLVGHSMGGAVVIRAAAQLPLVKVTIAESAYTSLEDNIEQGVKALTGLPPFPFAPLMVWFGERESGAQIHLIRPIDELQTIAPRAIMFIHGGQDELVHPKNSRDLYEAASEPKKLFIIPEAGHGGLLEADPIEFENRIITFLDQYLK